MTALGQPADLAAAVMSRSRERVDRALAALCERQLADMAPRTGAAIRYSLLGEGKRLRPTLVLAAYAAAGGELDAAALAAAVEVVHAYSLVHDDLPCMDDDDVRRGRPTVHRAFGVDVATAAGVAMVPLAALASFEAACDLGLGEVTAAEIVRLLMRASGAAGMIAGQLLDLEAEGLTLSLEQLEQIHAAKTGALITASVVIGAIAAGAGPAERAALERYGQHVGLAFQIADDVLDVTETTDVLGKTAGRDLALHKSTYPALLGVEGAMARARRVVDDACAALAEVGMLTPELESLARFSVARRS